MKDLMAGPNDVKLTCFAAALWESGCVENGAVQVCENAPPTVALSRVHHVLGIMPELYQEDRHVASKNQISQRRITCEE